MHRSPSGNGSGSGSSSSSSDINEEDALPSEHEEDDQNENNKFHHSLLVFSGFQRSCMETMRQFVHVGQCIETQCLATAIVKYTFLSHKDEAVVILFENAPDADLIIETMHGMQIDDVSESLIVKRANIELTKRIQSLFREIEKKKAKFFKEQWEKRQQRQSKEDSEENKEETKQTEQVPIEMDTFLEKTEMEKYTKPFDFGRFLQIEEDVKSVEKNEVIEAKMPNEVRMHLKAENSPMNNVKKNEIRLPNGGHSIKSEFKAEDSLKNGILNIVGSDHLSHSSTVDDEMLFEIEQSKILSYFGESAMAKYIKKMLIEQEIYVWQYRNAKKTQWMDVDMMLSLYLSILPLNEEVSIKTTKSKMTFSLIRRSVSNGILVSDVNGKCVEYKLNRISKSMENGVYIPHFWEKELLNRCIDKTYLYSIDLNVFEHFGKEKYPNWYGYLKEYVKNGRIESMASIQNWINYHSFNFYSNWQCATRSGYRVRRLWYLERNSIRGMNVLKNGFMSSSKANGVVSKGWTFYNNLQSAIDGSMGMISNVILLCNVCVDGKNEKDFQRNNGNGSCTLRHSLCAYPELYIRITK